MLSVETSSELPDTESNSPSCHLSEPANGKHSCWGSGSSQGISLERVAEPLAPSWLSRAGWELV